MNAVKNLIIGVCLVSASTVTYAQGMHSSHERAVPASVKESFHKDYPDADATNWKYVNGRWNADFRKMNENVSMAACYDGKGRRIDSRIPVAQNAVPEKVVNRVNQRFPGRDYRFTKIDRRGKRDLYMVRVKQRSGYKTLYLDHRGRETSYAAI
jgi:hypothetical protein